MRIRGTALAELFCCFLLEDYRAAILACTHPHFLRKLPAGSFFFGGSLTANSRTCLAQKTAATKLPHRFRGETHSPEKISVWGLGCTAFSRVNTLLVHVGSQKPTEARLSKKPGRGFAPHQLWKRTSRRALRGSGSKSSRLLIVCLSWSRLNFL